MINRLQKIAVSSMGVASTLAMTTTVFAGDLVGTIEPGKGWATNFGSLVSSVLTIVMVVALLLVLLYLVLGGIEWITSGGDKGKTESARNKITSAIIGIIILAAAFALTQLVAYILGFDGIQGALNEGLTGARINTTGDTTPVYPAGNGGM